MRNVNGTSRQVGRPEGNVMYAGADDCILLLSVMPAGGGRRAVWTVFMCSAAVHAIPVPSSTLDSIPAAKKVYPVLAAAAGAASLDPACRVCSVYH